MDISKLCGTAPPHPVTIAVYMYMYDICRLILYICVFLSLFPTIYNTV